MPGSLRSSSSRSNSAPLATLSKNCSPLPKWVVLVGDVDAHVVHVHLVLGEDAAHGQAERLLVVDHGDPERLCLAGSRGRSYHAGLRRTCLLIAAGQRRR